MNRQQQKQDPSAPDETTSSMPNQQVSVERPLGDRGERGRTWTPPHGEQGISNRPNDAGVDVAEQAEDVAVVEEEEEDEPDDLEEENEDDPTLDPDPDGDETRR